MCKRTKVCGILGASLCLIVIAGCQIWTTPGYWKDLKSGATYGKDAVTQDMIQANDDLAYIPARQGILNMVAETMKDPAFSGIPYFGMAAGLFGIVAGVGTGIQSMRLRGRVDTGEVVAMVNAAKSITAVVAPQSIKTATGSPPDLGNVVAMWNPGSKTNKKLKAKYEAMKA